MVYLFWAPQDFGLAEAPAAKAVYNSLDEAQAQAEHDLQLGRHPLRVEDADTGAVLWEAPTHEE
jgi:hypothetical protein